MGLRGGIIFNENNPYAAAWLRNLYPKEVVDERSITDLQERDMLERSHLFAGIGGWEYALQLAGWPSDRPVWTGSCPCQPFSNAGKRKGSSDDRHLWPEMLRLISECRPPTIFGEQVASKLGREWLSGVRADLEALGYAVGAADLCAASVGAPHIRQRLYWVADTDGRDTCDGELQRSRRHDVITEDETIGRMGDAERSGLQRQRAKCQLAESSGQSEVGRTSGSFWTPYDLIPCADGKARRVEPGTFPLAHGVPARVGKLRAYGNAIVPPLAAVFIRSFLETQGSQIWDGD